MSPTEQYKEKYYSFIIKDYFTSFIKTIGCSGAQGLSIDVTKLTPMITIIYSYYDSFRPNVMSIQNTINNKKLRSHIPRQIKFYLLEPWPWSTSFHLWFFSLPKPTFLPDSLLWSSLTPQTNIWKRNKKLERVE